MSAVRCRLYRGNDEVETWVHDRIPADQSAVKALIVRQRDRAIRGDNPDRYRCDVHDEATGEFLYELEESR